MRLTKQQQTAIKHLAEEIFGRDVVVIVFGSRVDDTKKGGDLDLLIKTNQAVNRPAVDAARMASRVSRLMNGRKVDVLIQAPTLKTLPIHTIAQETGIRLS
jgi:predicted nucleotidyltransferase